MTPIGPSLTHEQCQDLHTALRTEWLETNGLGGYASSSIHNCNTRKYHGLLVAGLADAAIVGQGAWPREASADVSD